MLRANSKYFSMFSCIISYVSHEIQSHSSLLRAEGSGLGAHGQYQAHVRIHTATTRTRQQQLASPLQMSANLCNILLLSISYSLKGEKSQ